MPPRKNENGIINLSYAQLRDVAGDCSHKWEMVHILGIEAPQDNRRLLVPNILDWSLSTWINQGFPQGQLVPITLEHYDAQCKRLYYRWKSPMDQREQREVARRAAWNLEFSMRQQGLCRGNGVASTQNHLKAEIGDLVLRGRPDLLLSDTLEIYDLKTTDNNKWLDWDQLYYYELVIRKMMGRASSKIGFLVPMMDPPVQAKQITKENLEHIRDKILLGADRIRRGEFKAYVSDECFMCFFKQPCLHYNRPVKSTAADKGNFRKASL